MDTTDLQPARQSPVDHLVLVDGGANLFGGEQHGGSCCVDFVVQGADCFAGSEAAEQIVDHVGGGVCIAASRLGSLDGNDSLGHSPILFRDPRNRERTPTKKPRIAHAGAHTQRGGIHGIIINEKALRSAVVGGAMQGNRLPVITIDHRTAQTLTITTAKWFGTERSGSLRKTLTT
jgi:hypothetical protein